MVLVSSRLDEVVLLDVECNVQDFFYVVDVVEFNFVDVVWVDFCDVFFIFLIKDDFFYVSLFGSQYFFFDIVNGQDFVVQGNFFGYGYVGFGLFVGKGRSQCCKYGNVC